MKRKSLIVSGLVVLVLLVAGAAFVGGRLLNLAAPSGGLVPGGSAGGKRAIHLEVIPASELPASAPDAIGPFVERGDNSIVSAWGERRGDRVVARVVVYTPAEVIPAPDR